MRSVICTRPVGRAAFVQSQVAVIAVGATLAFSTPGSAGNGANFVLYNHHTEPKGTAAFMVMTDLSTDVEGEPAYKATMIEFEYGVTDWWAFEFMAEGQQTDGDDFVNTGWRLENRFRLLPYGAFLNPVIYTEYESLKPETKYLMEVSGRTDTPEPAGPEKDERIFETRLILGQDVTDRLNVAFDWINETDTRTGDTAFGYAFGLNYLLYSSGGEGGQHKGHRGTSSGKGSPGHGGPAEHANHLLGSGEPDPFTVSHVQLGFEMFGAAGDSILGLTLDPDVTAHYAGVNVLTHFESGLHLMVGVAAGLTDVSEDRLVRTMVGYEF